MQSVDEWLPLARRLDPQALTEIYQALSPRLYRYAYRLLGNACDAEDMVAETFHRFLLAVQHGGGPSQHLMAYLYRITHNLVTDRYRRHPNPELALDEVLEVDDEHDPAQTAQSHMTQARARAALWRLTPEQRLVIMLKYFEGLSNEEVAVALDKPIGAVKALQHRALVSLRRILAAESIESVA